MKLRKSLFNQRAASLCTMALRGAGLIGRFGLALYLARYLGLGAVGAFGLIQGLVGATPAIIGLGLNYYVGREIVEVSKYRSGQVLRDRLTVTFLAVGFIVLLTASLAELGGSRHVDHLGLVLPVLAMECIALDVHMALISLRKPLTANILLFIRSAAWVFPTVMLGLKFSSLRTLSFMLEMWAIGDGISLISLVLVFWSWPAVAIFKTKVNFRWLLHTIRQGWLIYLNDIAIVGQIYLDRYVVGHFLGIRATGLYTLDFTLANSVVILVTTGMIQLALPHLVSAARINFDLWRKRLVKEAEQVLVACILLGLIVMFSALYVFPKFGLPQYAQTPILLILMLAGAVVKCVSDTLNYGLYSSGKDKVLASCNIFGVFLSFMLDRKSVV